MEMYPEKALEESDEEHDWEGSKKRANCFIKLIPTRWGDGN